MQINNFNRFINFIFEIDFGLNSIFVKVSNVNLLSQEELFLLIKRLILLKKDGVNAYPHDLQNFASSGLSARQLGFIHCLVIGENINYTVLISCL